MPRIYTRTGDDGTTGLIGGKRLTKNSPRIEAYGSVDELNSVLGVARTYGLPELIEKILARIQDELFTIGANLALTEGVEPDDYHVPQVTDASVEALEKEIDKCEEQLEPLRRFILPGGTPAGAILHMARSVGRRAERSCVALAACEKVDPVLIRYLNRLSDLIFVLARLSNHIGMKPEVSPKFSAC
jgi:cob(I)alamin adenosyltransferase